MVKCVAIGPEELVHSAGNNLKLKMLQFVHCTTINENLQVEVIDGLSIAE